MIRRVSKMSDLELDFRDCKTKEDVEKVFNRKKKELEITKTAFESFVSYNQPKLKESEQDG